MTETHLRELFQAAAPEVERYDVAAVDRAWRDGSRRRTGARLAVVGSVAATAGIVLGIAALDRPVTEVGPARAPGSPTQTPSGTADRGTVVARRSGEYDGAPLWWAPSAAEEASLPVLSVPSLPPVIDLDAARVGPVGEPVVATFWGRAQTVFVLTATARLVELDTSRLEPVTDEGGNSRSPLSHHSLSPDGSRAFFIQNSSVEVLDFVRGEWTSVDTPDWLAEGARWFEDDIWVPNRLGDETRGTVYPAAGGDGVPTDVDWGPSWQGPGAGAWGPVASSPAGTAQAAFLAGGVVGGSVSNPQAIVVEHQGGESVLALDYRDGPGEGTRGKGCCFVLGWVDDDTVLFLSSSTEGQRVLAWDVGTEAVRLVSEIRGEGGIAALLAVS